MKEELEQFQILYNVITEFLVNYSFQIIGALIILMIGVLVAKKVSQVVYVLCQKKNVDVTLTTFLTNVTKIIIIVMVAIICLGKLGISVTPMVAAIGAASLGAGLAFQGLLSNYGAGFTIILTRPFVVGDTIKIQDITGVVKEITLSMTILEDEDQVEITIPNKHIIGEVYYNSKANKLVAITIGIEYGANPEKALEVISNALKEIPEIANEPQPLIGIDEFGDSSINIGLRYWAPTKKYYDTKYKTNLAVYHALKTAEINIPFPQREVRLLQDN